jgi:uncharacterized protein (DUF1800 family)
MLILCLSGVAHAMYGADTPMDEAVARAILNRLGYGATPALLARTVGLTPRQYVARAIGEPSVLPAPVLETIESSPVSAPVQDVWMRLGPGGSERSADPDEAARQRLQQLERQHVQAAVQVRLLTMANADNPGREVLLSFWLNHFSIFAPKGPLRLLAWDYVQTLDRAMSQDSFDALLRASFYSPAMQLYLDNAQSTAPDSEAAMYAARQGRTLGLNENLARELLELHTLGVEGGYTQRDVQALARIISGAGVWTPRMQERQLARAGAVRRGLFLFDPRRHDDGVKVLLGQEFPAGRGLDEIDRALRLLARHPATARHVSRKLAVRFLSDDPPEAVLRAMSQAFLDSGGRISSTLVPLLQSSEFALALAQRSKFKEPVDYVLSVTRAVCGDQPITNGAFLLTSLQGMGQAPLMRTTPDGYGALEADWMSPTAMSQRVRLALGAAAGRLPLAASAVDDTQPGSRAASCEGRPEIVEQMVGPLGAQTLSAGAALSDRERVALRLASPEFMRR